MGKSILMSNIRTEIRRQNMGYRVEQTYVGWITRFIYYHNLTHPKRLGEKEVVEFLNHLAVDRDLPQSVQTEARAALSFLYKHVLKRPLSELKGIIQGENTYSGWSARNYRKKQVIAS